MPCHSSLVFIAACTRSPGAANLATTARYQALTLARSCCRVGSHVAGILSQPPSSRNSRPSWRGAQYVLLFNGQPPPASLFPACPLHRHSHARTARRARSTHGTHDARCAHTTCGMVTPTESHSSHDADTLPHATRDLRNAGNSVRACLSANHTLHGPQCEMESGIPLPRRLSVTPNVFASAASITPTPLSPQDPPTLITHQRHHPPPTSV